MTFLADMGRCVCLQPGRTEELTPTITQSFYGATAAISFLWATAFTIHAVKTWVPGCCLAKCWPLKCTRPATKVNEKARELFQKRRLQRFSTFVSIAWIWVVPVLLFFVALGIQTVSTIDAAGDLYSNVLSFSIALLTAVFLMALGNFKRVPPILIEASYATIYTLVAIPPAFAATPLSFNFYTSISVLTQMFLSQVYPGRRMALVLNALCLGWRMGTLSATPALLEMSVTNSMVAVMTFVYNMAISFSVVSTMEAEAVALVGEREATSSSKCLQSLLSVMCDAVVLVRPDLSLWEPSQALATMLLRSPGLTLDSENQSFTRFLAPADVERFANFVRANSEEVNTARAIHVHLVDSMSAKVPVQVFHTCTRDPWDESEKHLLCVVEDVERAEHRGIEMPTNLRPSPLPPHRAESAMSDSLPSASSDVGGLSYWSPTDADGAEARVTIRTSLKVEVLRESETSRIYFGFGEELSEAFVTRFRRSRFLQRWLEFNHVMAACGKVTHDRLSYGKVGFLNVRTGVEYKGKLRALVTRAPVGQSAREEETPLRTYGNWADILDQDQEFVEMELRFRPPKLNDRPPSSRSVTPVRRGQVVQRPTERL